MQNCIVITHLKHENLRNFAFVRNQILTLGNSLRRLLSLRCRLLQRRNSCCEKFGRNHKNLQKCVCELAGKTCYANESKVKHSSLPSNFPKTYCECFGLQLEPFSTKKFTIHCAILTPKKINILQEAMVTR